MSKSYRRDVLLGKIYSEGYCCLWGYFTFCQAKGQGTRSISEWHGVSIDAVRHHFRRMRAGGLRLSGHHHLHKTRHRSRFPDEGKPLRRGFFHTHRQGLGSQAVRMSASHCPSAPYPALEG